MGCICGNEIVPNHGDLYRVVGDQHFDKKLQKYSITLERIGFLKDERFNLTISEQDYNKFWKENRVVVILKYNVLKIRAAIYLEWIKDVYSSELVLGKKKLIVDLIDPMLIYSPDPRNQTYAQLREEIDAKRNLSTIKNPELKTKGEEKDPLLA